MKNTIAISALCVLTFAVGRWSVPTKIIEKEKIVEVEKTEKKESELEDTKKNKKTKTVITEKTLPDGSKEKKTEIVEDEITDQTKTVHRDEKTETDKTTDKSSVMLSKRGTFVISGLIGTNFSSGLDLNLRIYGVSIQKHIIGPVTVGLWGLSNSTGGVSLGLEF